ncbi:Pal1-domain-containing protein [Rhizodiscina lignyota]|uniref:Pal1-domain-containing protein n=1 Tax=Rhizodiscina lignyota TaxID=1504668 RepID=A0A9P4MBC9_9PEZI|nr:Pal1-domain-containing protein [Rhizodiscina lignyota]
MSTDVVPFTSTDRRPPVPPGLNLSLNSNNPFRNRANSPGLPSPAFASPGALPTPTINSERPASRNPFLAAFEQETNNNLRNMAAGDTGRSSSPQQNALDSNTRELFNNLTLSDKQTHIGAARVNAPQRSETLPVAGHRPHRSDEDNQSRPDGGRRPSRPHVLPSNEDPFASPERRERREQNGPGPRPRRTNSESSVHRPMTEEEKRARDQRRRERERRHRERGERDRDGKDGKDGKPRERSKSSRPRKPNAGLDLIDKLDVTGIYGPGLFHHDGPFDACNPHRNRKRDVRAPMQAFPTDSKNNTLGGSGPLNKNFDLDRIRGTGTEGYEDYSYAPNRTNGNNYHAQTGRKYSFERERAPGVGQFDPFSKTELQHGEESVGLGTSTFLEGTQASRSAMHRRDSENDNVIRANGVEGFQGGNGNASGLTRKKSLAQRFRAMSQPKRGDSFNGQPGIPGAGGSPKDPSSPDSPPRKGSVTTTVKPVYPASAGGRIGGQVGDNNPFFDEYDDAFERKGASIRVANGGADMENGTGGGRERPMQRTRDRAPSSPMRGVALERRATNDGETNGFGGGAAGGAPVTGGGFLNRVKSLKGRKKT